MLRDLFVISVIDDIFFPLPPIWARRAARIPYSRWILGFQFI
jgi:hypothetical protein